jgi:hypothetical protein
VITPQFVQLTGFAVCGGLPATRTILVQLKAILGIAAVLLGDVVALFALGASHSDLGPNVSGFRSHEVFPLKRWVAKLAVRAQRRK